MKKLRNVLATLVVIASVLAAVYVGVWEMFVGGIVQGIEAVKMTPVSSYGIAIGVVRIIFAGAVGYLVLAIGLIIAGLIGTKKYKFKTKRGRK